MIFNINNAQNCYPLQLNHFSNHLFLHQKSHGRDFENYVYIILSMVSERDNRNNTF